MSKLIERREEMRAKQAALAGIFEQAGPDLDLSKVEALKGYADTTAKAAEVKRLNDELTALGREVEGLATVERAAADVKAAGEKLTQPVGGMTHPNSGPAQPEQVKSLGEMFTDSLTFKQFDGRRGPRVMVPNVNLKTLMTTTAGWAPLAEIRAGYVSSAQRMPNVVDLLPSGSTSNGSIVYMLETTFTNNAAARTEGANNAGEAALALTLTTALVQEIAVWLPVTREQLDDVPYVQSYINQRLGLMLRQVLETEVMTGNAAPPHLVGLIGLAGGLTQAKGADPTPDAVYKAMTQIRVTGRAEPSGTIWHPNDWQDVRLLRTADGVYIWGSPSDAGPERIWGLPVVQSTACTENTACVGDFTNYSQLVTRQGIELEITDSHASLFIQRTLAVLATLRACMIWYRPAATCVVTGI